MNEAKYADEMHQIIFLMMNNLLIDLIRFDCLKFNRFFFIV